MTKCIIHIGMHKTGTSSIQQSLNGFADESFVYANIDGHANHSKALARLFVEDRDERLALNIREDTQDESSALSLDRVMNEAGGRTVLCSGEGLSIFSHNALLKLHRFFSIRCDEFTVVAAVRPPGGYMASAVQEPIKRGVLQHLDPAKRYRRYKKTFEKFDEIFGRENVQLWKYDPQKFPGGCAVQDFCRRLGIDFPIERIVRVNEAISREALGLLFVYCKFGAASGTVKNSARVNKVLLREIMKIGTSKFRFSPDVVRPILEKNRADTAWMESRLGQSLAEDLGEHQAGDVHDENDLLTTSPDTVEELLTMLGEYAPKDVAGHTPEEVALLVHSLRRSINPARREVLARPAGKSSKITGYKGSCIIHVGMHKTGTSSIQTSLRGFENDQVVYFSGEKKYGNHSGVIFSLLGSRGEDRPAPGEVPIGNAALTMNELERSILSLHGRTLLFSGEGIRFLSLDELKKLRDLFKELGMVVRIVAYIRPPAAFLTSLAQQLIKGCRGKWLQLDWDFCNYQKSFSKFDTVFGPENVQLWKFDPKTLLNGCVVQDFCRRLGFDFPVDRVVRVNESLSKEALSLLYFYQQHASKNERRSTIRQETRLMVESMMAKIKGEKFRISPDVLRPVLAANRADIEWMESRLGESLAEDLGEQQPGDVRKESDLNVISPEAVAGLNSLFGEEDAAGLQAETPEDTVRLVHALRKRYPAPVRGRKPRKEKRGSRRKVMADNINDLPWPAGRRQDQNHRNGTKKIHFFVHIPKTAGTSFRKALEKNESVRMLYDYGEKSKETSREMLAIDPGLLTPDNDIFHPDKHNILCGHVRYQQYGHCVSGNDVFAIVRNPVERIVSEYQHLKRHAGLLKSFDEYCLIAAQQDKQLKILQGLETEGEVLIGLTSHYKYFVELFSDRLSLPIETIAVNKAPDSDTADRLQIDVASIKAAYKINEKDTTYFFDLVRRFAATVGKVGYNTIPVKDTIWSCSIVDGKQVFGWFSCSEKDCFFVVLKVNGENRAVVSLDQYRKDIFTKGLSRNPVCGFSYPLSLLGAQQGDTVTVGILDFPIFEKNLIIE